MRFNSREPLKYDFRAVRFKTPETDHDIWQTRLFGPSLKSDVYSSLESDIFRLLLHFVLGAGLENRANTLKIWRREIPAQRSRFNGTIWSVIYVALNCQIGVSGPRAATMNYERTSCTMTECHFRSSIRFLDGNGAEKTDSKWAP